LIYTTLSCAAQLGQTICATATIFPNDDCGMATYTGPFIETTASCVGDSVVLEIINSGLQDMGAPLDYIVVEDILMRDGSSFTLPAGERLTRKYKANGNTWRIEAGQVSEFPFNDMPSAAIEGCGGAIVTGVINAFPLNDDMLYKDIDCKTVVGSYDPNDKSASPTGYNPEHIIEANTDLEYMIRFQNTGTDTAFTVVIVDTLSSLLDYSTLESGVSSHTYRLDVLPNGILRFVFNNILLPDSSVNEAASNGFVKFRIAQKPDLPIGTVINNSAAIYFDFNEPIITNTVFHTIGAPYVMVSRVHQPILSNVEILASPNPFEAAVNLQINGYTAQNGLFRLYAIDGREVRTQAFSGNRLQVNRLDLVSGNYFFFITDNGQSVGSGLLQCK
jgi:uncharacterized repeat protein (TIGR01451 family)